MFTFLFLLILLTRTGFALTAHPDVLFWCIWSYLCHCKSRCASTPRNQLTHQSPRGRLNIGVFHQNVGSACTLKTGSELTQVFAKQLFFYFDMKTWLCQTCQGTVLETKGAKGVHIFMMCLGVEGILTIKPSYTTTIEFFHTLLSITELP